jgi:hypothetical protein
LLSALANALLQSLWLLQSVTVYALPSLSL